MTLQYTRWPLDGIILGMGSANERQRYHVTSSQNDPFSSGLLSTLNVTLKMAR